MEVSPVPAASSTAFFPDQVEDEVYDLLPDNAGTGLYALPMPSIWAYLVDRKAMSTNLPFQPFQASLCFGWGFCKASCSPWDNQGHVYAWYLRWRPSFRIANYRTEQHGSDLHGSSFTCADCPAGVALNVPHCCSQSRCPGGWQQYQRNCYRYMGWSNFRGAEGHCNAYQAHIFMSRGRKSSAHVGLVLGVRLCLRLLALSSAVGFIPSGRSPTRNMTGWMPTWCE